MRARFRFEDLEVWKLSVEVAIKLFQIADILDKRRFYRFAEQIRGAALSAPNNIAEGSGSSSKKDFIHFLNIARRSTFETASMLIIFEKIKLIEQEFKDDLLENLDKLGRMLTLFSRSLSK